MLKQLLIDIGNTRLKWLLMQDENVLAGGQWVHDSARGLVLTQIAINESPEQIVVSNVAGDKLTSEIVNWASDAYSLSVQFVMAASKSDGIENAYNIAEDLGADRWACLVACHHLYQTDVCIIDAGSAITIDLLTAKGIHLGGYIIPGITSMRQTLSRDTMLKHDFKNGGQSAVQDPGKSTEQCINNGSLFTVCHTIEAAVKLFESETGRKIQCVLTGGDSNQLSGKLAIPHRIEPSLVLQGLALIGKHLVQTS